MLGPLHGSRWHVITTSSHLAQMSVTGLSRHVTYLGEFYLGSTFYSLSPKFSLQTLAFIIALNTTEIILAIFCELLRTYKHACCLCIQTYVLCGQDTCLFMTIAGLQ